MLFSAEKAKLAAQIEELESTNSSLTQQLATITAERDDATQQIASINAAHAARITELESAHEAAVTAARAAAEADVDTRISTAVTDALAAAGVPESQLPARGSAETTEASVEDLREQLAAESDPRKAGAIVAKIKAIQNKAKAN